MPVSEAGTRDTVQSGLYQEGNKYVVSYKSNEGILALPLAEASPTDSSPVEIVRLHQPNRIRTVEFENTKGRTPPFIPAPEDNDLEYLLSSEMLFPLPSINADVSSLVWQAMGRMEFVERGSWTVASGYRIGDYPVLNTPGVLGGIMAVAGGLAGLAAEDAYFGETLADNLGNPNAADYATKSYDYQRHFPSKFLVSELAKGN